MHSRVQQHPISYFLQCILFGVCQHDLSLGYFGESPGFFPLKTCLAVITRSQPISNFQFNSMMKQVQPPLGWNTHLAWKTFLGVRTCVRARTFFRLLTILLDVCDLLTPEKFFLHSLSLLPESHEKRKWSQEIAHILLLCVQLGRVDSIIGG